MAIERKTFLYEILLRFGPEGFSAAHVADLERVSDGDDIISDRELPARSLSVEEVGDLLGHRNAELIVAVEHARAEAAAANAKVAEMQAIINGIADRSTGIIEALRGLAPSASAVS